eukprot:22189_1
MNTLFLWIAFLTNPKAHAYVSESSDVSDIECIRHRKPWHLISDDERLKFVLGFQQLRSNGKLSVFAETHHLEGTAKQKAHQTSEFFFWHSYFVWEMETQFRNISEDYKCFSMPYWDFTHDALYDTTDYLPIFDSMLGANGNINNDYCLEDDLWNVNVYKTEFLCADNETPPNCCLKRFRNAERSLINSSQITDSFALHRFRDFEDTISVYHGKIHKFMAKTNASHMWENNAVEDPLFVLLHSFIDYVRLLREDCWQFDQISSDQLDDFMPFAFDNYDVYDDDVTFKFKPTFDTPMEFAYIANSTWSYIYSESSNVTIRDMFDTSTWGVQYELGTFWNDNDKLQGICGDKLNSTWFNNEMGEHDLGSTTRTRFPTKNSQIMSVISMIMAISSLLFLICIVIGKSCNGCVMKHEKEISESLISDNQSNYGTV